ncbi:hypothetical protein [Lentzea guizhouensis]|nr:hypothetical protein [Lentzea guizhouensis]
MTVPSAAARTGCRPGGQVHAAVAGPKGDAGAAKARTTGCGGGSGQE